MGKLLLCVLLAMAPVPSSGCAARGQRHVELDRALLATSDFPAGWSSGAASAPDLVSELEAGCPVAPSAPVNHRIGQQAEAFHAGTAIAAHRVERFEPGWAPRTMDKLRRLLGECARFDAGDRLHTYAILEQNFAADESLLIKSVRVTPPTGTDERYAAVVRRGDLIATVTGAGIECDQVRHLGRVAADRLPPG